MNKDISILIIYTGGTIGMVRNSHTGALQPLDFEDIYHYIPALNFFDFEVDSYCFEPVIDSSNMEPAFWVDIAEVIAENYGKYDGFVILHGSDTMAYTASALSFMLENLNKPVILTGSQLPLGIPRTDGRENLITALEIAAAKEDDTPIVPEVVVYFENQLFRGNRTHKFNAEHFEAFKSVNYPILAEAGVYIKYNRNAIRKPNFKNLKLHKKLETNIGSIRLYPGINSNLVSAILNIDGLKGIVLETFGNGNGPNHEWFIELLKRAIERGTIILNVTQCKGGSVEMGKYETSLKLKDIGVLNGFDITYEAAMAKMMYLFGKPGLSKSDLRRMLETPVQGEMTI